MTAIKLDSKLPNTLEGLADKLYADLGGHHMASVEFEVIDRNDPADPDDVTPWVKLRIVALEIADDGDTAAELRNVKRDLYGKRTAAGTLDEIVPEGVDSVTITRGSREAGK